MTSSPRRVWPAALAVLALVTACTAEPATPTEPSPTATPSAAYIDTKQAFYILNRLVAASGSDHLLKLRVTRESAEIAVVTSAGAQTWAWRNGGPAQVDGDTRDVGQARFRLSDIRYDNFPELFEMAAAMTGSRQSQELQVVEYSAGTIYLTVTTTPETSTVFFRPDGTLVPRLDWTDANDLRRGFDDVVAGRSKLLRFGIDPALGMYADAVTPTGRLVRQIRNPRFPVREDTVPAPVPEQAFASADVDLTKLRLAMVAMLTSPQGRMSCEIRYVEQLKQPLARLDNGQRVAYLTLAGDDVTSQIK